ncbi:MAG: cell wall-binding repeat-containing protein, partial [Bacilli bacterium]|nr:cell wall-binding repeat-containing protein [Bacilli bacterium]
YIIGGEDVISKNIEEILNKDDIHQKRIAGKDRFETNAKVIENFYKENTINKLFYCKGKSIDKKDEIIDGMLVASLAGKEKAPIILLGEKLDKAQKSALDKKNIKSLIQVGYGVSEEAKKELYKIKENYTPPSLDDSSISNPIQKPNNPVRPPLDYEIPSVTEVIPPGNIEDTSKPTDTPPDEESSNSPGDTEDTSQPEETPPTENEILKYIDYTISENKKNISINFNKEIYTSKENIEELKESIKIIYKNNINNNQEKEYKSTESNQDNQEKYLKLNKYDNVRIDKNSLIIELEDGLIGNSSSIVVNDDIIKDKEGNYAKQVRTDEIDGIDKNIAFVENENEFLTYIDCKDIDIIKLENNIFSDKVNTFIRIKDNIIIDGSNGESNFKIINSAPSLKRILISGNNVKLKNLDLEGLYIEMMGKENIYFKNMKIDLQDKKIPSFTIFTPGIIIDFSQVEAKDLILISEGCGIELKSTNYSNKRSTLIIDGYVYNEKVDEYGNYKP